MEIQQLIDRMRESLRAVRWNSQTAALLLLACCTMLGIFVIQWPNGSQEATVRLFDSRTLTSAELQNVEAALGKAELPHQVELGSVIVPRSQRGKYLAALQDAKCLPQSFDTPTQDALDAGGILENPRKSAQRLHLAKEQKASLAIRALGGVEEAYVLFDEKPPASSFQRGTLATAAVGVQTNKDQPYDLQLHRAIVETLVGCNAKLTRADISITELNSRQTFRGSASEPGSVGYRELARMGLEHQWEERIQSVLTYIPDATIHVRVEPGETGVEAESVRVSVGLPSTYVQQLRPQIAAGEDGDVADAVCRKIQATVLPLLPQSDESMAIDELIAVNVFPVMDQQATVPTGQHNVSRFALMSGLVIAFLASGAFLVVSFGRSAEPAAASLRVFDADPHAEPDAVGDKVSADADELREVDDSDPATMLRAFVKEDPAAAAQSLSDFIDRAS